MNMKDTHPEALMRQAIRGTLHNAQDGELPLFAWTLGMALPTFHTMLAQCLPELAKGKPLTTQQHSRLSHNTPPDFALLVDLIYAHRDAAIQPLHTEWLARTLAAACFGSRHLWEDMGLSGREEVSLLLQHYFPALHALNIQSLKWKHFLFKELGMQRGQPGLRPPTCERCENYALCFPSLRVERCPQ